ncbi:MAG: RluA family pseudouridine synthase [Scytolyngbya sp. HA4215-MV1]|jgi:23S rRNA pseudouridine1911/1915/1917 synthase|nr:RluA family pseudouridine synthase [Scytolyngbya sp. HA4215-MV1]
MNQGWIYDDRIDRTAQELTVLEYYTQRYRHSSQAEWQARLIAGQIYLDGKPTHADMRLKLGQQLTYHRAPWQEPEVPLNFEVLYEDADLLIVAKPAGLPVLPGGGFLENTLLTQLKQRYPQTPPVPIHRLGRGTSGLLLLARSSQARAHLTQQMRDRKIQKVYRALVGAGEIPTRFTVTQAIGKIPHPTLGYIYGATATGLTAHSECQVLHRYPTVTLLEVTILTGRPHQIRIHLAAAGFPLVGDPLYGIGGIPQQQTVYEDNKLVVPGNGGYWLHAYHLTFIHPTTGKSISQICPAPTPLLEPDDFFAPVPSSRSVDSSDL